MGASAGLHPVAEKGPELVLAPGYRLFRGGEQVLNATQTERAVVDRRYATAAPPRYVAPAPTAAAAPARSNTFNGPFYGADVRDLANELESRARHREALQPDPAWM